MATPDRPSRQRYAAAFVAVLAMAAALRFPALAARPMHADEAVHADKLGTLLEQGSYAYDPSEYHGPTLYYMTLLPLWLQGVRRYVDLDEVALRSVPAALGVALVAAHVAGRGFLGPWGAALTALLTALSPALVFYSRYYIHETPLVLFSFGALLALWSYLRRPSAAAAALGGACTGLMLATKETAPLALAAMLLALVLTAATGHAPGRPPGEPLAETLRSLSAAHALLAIAVAAGVSAAFFSSFWTHPAGIVDALRASRFYVERAGNSWHVHPWDYYLRLLVHFPAEGTPFWTEGVVLLLALVGGIAGFTAKTLPGEGAEVARGPLERGADPRVLCFLSFYSLVLLGIYSAIPYKTPWCVLGFLHGMILLAGAGAVFLLRAARGPVSRLLIATLLLAGVAHLGWQAWAASFRFPADPGNPYVYAHTSEDVFRIVARLEGIAQAHPAGRSLPVQVISAANVWPLPWYLRRFPSVAWWTGVSETAPSAPVVLLTPDQEPALVHKLYDLPPPGERELYVSAFEQPVELRPQVEIRGYVANGLWDAFRRLESDPPSAPDAQAPAGRPPSGPAGRP